MAGSFPRGRCILLVTAILCLLLVAWNIIDRHQRLTGPPSLPAPWSGDGRVLEDLRSRVRLLCLIPTSTRNLQRKAAAVRDTWGRRCNTLLFFSEKNDSRFPTVGLGSDHEGLQMLTTKVRAALTYVHDHHLADLDWVVKADDDTYLVVENLRYLLSHYDPAEPHYFGHHFNKFARQGYMSGGAGYVLSRAALSRLVRLGFRQRASACRRWGGAEDAALGICLESLGVRPGDSRDVRDRQTFHPFNLLTHLSGTYPRWYYEYSKHKVTQGADCCSDFSISFHFVEPNVMRMMDHLLYNTQVYGLHQGAPPGAVFRPPGVNRTN